MYEQECDVDIESLSKVFHSHATKIQHGIIRAPAPECFKTVIPVERTGSHERHSSTYHEEPVHVFFNPFLRSTLDSQSHVSAMLETQKPRICLSHLLLNAPAQMQQAQLGVTSQINPQLNELRAAHAGQILERMKPQRKTGSSNSLQQDILQVGAM